MATLQSGQSSAIMKSDSETSIELNTIQRDVEAPKEAPHGPPPPPPNGGTRAWLQVLGAFFLNFNTWGLLNTFGIFQSEYSSGILSSSSESAISWIGSIQAFLMLVVCVLCGRLLDAGHFYVDIVAGVLLSVFGMMMTSLAKEYWQVLLAQGFAVGIGAGMVFMPAIQIIGTYFSTRRSTAMGLAAAGSSVGGIVYPILLRSLIPSVGLAWAIRILAFVMLGTLAISVCVMRPRRDLPPRKSGPLINVDSLRTPAFAIWLFAVFFTFIGLYIPFFYVSKYALNIGVSQDVAFYMLIIMNAGSVPGRIFPSMVADKIGNLNIMIPAVLSSGIIALAWMRATTQPGLIAVCFFLGLASGSIQAVLPANVPALCPDLTMLGTNLGMTMFASGLGLLIGSPVAGVILDRQSSASGEVYWGMLTFAGITVLVGGLLLIVVRVIRIGFAISKA
ncbi:major facilitator superfamily domain-containing protein [Diplogelasinospora grovesii]|uniref:Major facilitator superfamily domain-containing protein n=1 Tax=Diplogelasinospora grovesii TaxID=303347 RepID=A0AAN6S7E2_9PEZI|nr:major facilitator superfamily domain-containing protein [Diplogelasinospora grovesii]